MEDVTTPALRVLIVEDHGPTRRAMAGLLKYIGCKVTSAESVDAAIRSLSDAPNCIVLDLMLPDGNGISVLKYIRRYNLPTRVAVTTGTSDPKMLEEVAELNPDVVYRKPLDTSAFESWLRNSTA